MSFYDCATENWKLFQFFRYCLSFLNLREFLSFFCEKKQHKNGILYIFFVTCLESTKKSILIAILEKENNVVLYDRHINSTALKRHFKAIRNNEITHVCWCTQKDTFFFLKCGLVFCCQGRIVHFMVDVHCTCQHSCWLNL